MTRSGPTPRFTSRLDGLSSVSSPCHDGSAFASEFGKILSFRKNTQDLAAKVLFKLRQKFALPINSTTPINADAFYGAHLRLEKDAVWAWDPGGVALPRMEDQFREQFNYLMRTGLSVVYVASGDRTVVDLFDEYLQRRIAEEPSAGPSKGGDAELDRDSGD